MNSRAPLLVVGAGGMLGSHVCEAANAAGVPLIAASSRLDANPRLDLLTVAPERWIDDLPTLPGGAIVCSAQSNMDHCRNFPAAARRLNVEATGKLFSALAMRNIPTLYYSSDMVFSGDTGNYRENDECQPSTEYGRQKLEAEQQLQATGGPSLIVRLGKLYARDERDRSPLSDWFRSWNAGRATLCAEDQWLMPTWAGDVGAASIELLNQGRRGIVHLVAPEAFTRLDLARKLADIWGFDNNLVHACKIRDLPLAEPRPLNNCLSGERLTGWLNWGFFRVSALRYSAAHLSISGEKI